MFFRALLAVTYLFLALQTTRAFAESPIIDLHGPTSPEQLFGHIDYVLDPDWVRTAHDMVGSRSGDFRPVDKLTPDFGYTPSQVWLRLRARNATEHTKEWRLYFRENFKQIFDVYVARADGTIENTLSQDLERGFSSRPIPFPELVAPVDIEPGERVTLLVRFWSEGSSNLSIAV
ncbi:MAG TPA: 7TM-DISM domain-containing protein, partial [Rhizobiaceae bacterium]|nr:7TM-DISM domain-containing protein [Rhizobiaceae bacterium]